MCLQIVSVKSTAGNKTWLFPSFFLISTMWFLILAEAFRNDHRAAFSTAICSATEKNEMNGYVTVPGSFKMIQRSSRADGIKFERRYQIGCDGTHTEQNFTFKITLCIHSCNKYCELIDTVNRDLNYCTSELKKLDIYIYI